MFYTIEKFGGKITAKIQNKQIFTHFFSILPYKYSLFHQNAIYNPPFFSKRIVNNA